MMTLSVCIGSSCHLKGSYNIIQTFQQMIEEFQLGEKVTFTGSFCMKQCQNPGVGVNMDGEVFNITPEQARSFFKEKVLPKVQ